MTQISLSGKTALVTGGGQGLGKATVEALHSAGAAVAVNYYEEGQGSNRAKAMDLVAQLGERAIAVEADVRQLASVESMVQTVVAQFGGLDMVVNNAGILRDRSLKNMSLDEWQDVIDTNLSGVFNVCKAASPQIAEGGRIVNLASISAVMGTFGQANYAAAKAGVIGITKVLSRELARRNITVNAVAPGVVLTEMGRSIPESARQQMLSQIPLGRFAEPHEIAAVVLFLCSDLASYVSGQTLHVNGGWWS